MNGWLCCIICKAYIHGPECVCCRLFVVFLTAISVCWIPMSSDAQGGEVFRYSTTVTGYLGAPTCAMFILAMFWYRCNEPVSVVAECDVRFP